MSARRPGSPDDDFDPDEGESPPESTFRAPLPPEDRLWRHPSEIARQRSAGAGASRAARPVTAPVVAGPVVGPRLAGFMVASGLIGATLAVAGVALLGGFEDPAPVVQAAAAADASAQPPSGPERSATTTSTIRQRDPVAALAADAAPTVMALRVTSAATDAAVTAGSAIVYRDDGYLLTSSSLVEGADEIMVFLPGGEAILGRLVGADHASDVAVVHIDTRPLTPAHFGSTEGLQVGTATVTVAALSDHGWQSSVSTGVVSALGRRLQAADGTVLHDMILVDAPFGPGAAGGALLDADGAVVGLASAVAATDSASGRFGVATPIDLVHHVADQLIETGTVARAWLGVQGKDATPDQAMAAGVGGAVLVEHVEPGGPAGRAGLSQGDLIVTVDGDSVRSMSELIAVLSRRLPGDSLAVGVRRDGETHTMACTLGTRPTTVEVSAEPVSVVEAAPAAG